MSDVFTGDIICGHRWEFQEFPDLISNGGDTELWTQLKIGSWYYPGEGSEYSADTDWGRVVVVPGI